MAMAKDDVSDVARALKRLREQAGISVRDMASAIQVSPGSYQHYEDRFKKQHLPADFASSVAKALVASAKVSADEAAEILPVVDFPRLKRGRTARGPAKPDIIDTYINADRDLPVLGHAAGGNNGQFELNGEAVDYVFRPDALRSVPAAYALYMSGTSMEPRYAEGETIFVHPGKRPRPGEYAVFQTIADDQERPYAYVKQFVRQTDSEYVFKQLNPPREIVVPSAIIISCHKIILSGES